MSQDIPDQTAARDADHYWENVIFQVEDRLFKVPRYHFVKDPDSPFASAFSLPQGNLNAEGASDQNPVRLEGVKKEDFERLIKVMYPLTIPLNHILLPKDHWISVLKLSTMWHFLEIRALAIEHLTSMNIGPIDRIILARQYFVAPWLRSGYVNLAKRTDIAITVSEAEEIGWVSAIQVCEVREQAIETAWRSNRAGHRGPGGVSNHLPRDDDVVPHIERVFHQELRDAEAFSATYMPSRADDGGYESDEPVRSIP